MINFFRRIRKKMADDNKPLKYMRYAIGEILLVVVGILIALYINNWNEERQEKRLVQSYAKSLISDLEGDILTIEDVRSQMIELKTRIDTLSNHLRNNSLGKMSNLKILMLIIDDVYSPYSWNSTNIEELKSSGALRFKGNIELAQKIAEYDAFTKHMHEDYKTDQGLVEINFPLVRKVVNMNYSNFGVLSTLGHNNIPYVSGSSTLSEENQEKVVLLKKALKVAESNNLTLLTKDPNTINEMVNGYLILSRNLEVRYNSELPQLRKQAEEIISLLKKRKK
jgi:hypothetical protein